MRSLCAALAIILLHSLPPVRAQQTVTPDAVVRLLANLENVLAGGNVDAFRAIATPLVPDLAVMRFQMAARGGPGARAILRERSRRAIGDDVEVIADLLISRAILGRVSTWQILATPSAAGSYRIADVKELAAVDGLLRLRLDTSRQFAVKELNIDAPDLRLHMASGTAFVAESTNGVTALVLRGRGDVQFTPSDAAEQVQVRLISGKPMLHAQAEAMFVRMNPAEFLQRVSAQSLTAMPVDPGEAARAQLLFDEKMPLTYNIDLRSLTPERWSLEPPAGSLIAEFRTSRNGWLTYARSPAEPEDVSLFDRDNQRNIALYASTERLKERGRFYSEDDGTAFDVEHYRLDLSFDPARSWVSGHASLTVRITSSAVSSITIRLSPLLTVSSVSSPGYGEVLALRVVGQNSILLSLPTFVERGASLTFDVRYSGRIEPQSMDREAIALAAGEVDQQKPISAVESDVTRMAAEPRFIYSSRSPWYPQGQSSDYATVDMRLSVPADYQVVASGSLVRTAIAPALDAGRGGPQRSVRTSEFVSDRPVRYLACVISRLVPVGRTRVDVPGMPALNLDVMSNQRMAGSNRQMAPRVSSMLQYFAKTIGEAPYPDFTLTAVDDNLPGGHSPAFFAIFHQPLPTSPYSWSDDPVAFEDNYKHLFLAHEVAHQWWGQAIGWKNYHEQWLSEGLAQYFAALYAAQDRGPAMLDTLIQAMRESTKDYYDQGPISLGYRLGHIKRDGRVFRAVVYNKSAIVMHMLRRLIGDEAFFSGLRRFYSTYRFKKAGAEDLQAAFEAGTSLKLDRFFDMWIRGFAKPAVRASFENREEGGVIRIEQTRGVFDFPLTVSVQYADGKSEERTIKVTDRIVEERVPTPIRRVTVKDALTPVDIER
ncbi:MAG TPA: M1 family aminopeptidase [Vicinamibacterales bacterium]|nr:M1 family aminopeptidase [Vicinamibacterales bacterium]